MTTPLREDIARKIDPTAWKLYDDPSYARAAETDSWLRDPITVVEPSHRQAREALLASAEYVASQRDAFLSSPNLDPAWIAGWHSAIDHVVNHLRKA